MQWEIAEPRMQRVRGLMTHTQTERGRNQIRADLRLSQTTPVLFDESRNKHERFYHNKSSKGFLNGPITTWKQSEAN